MGTPQSPKQHDLSNIRNILDVEYRNLCVIDGQLTPLTPELQEPKPQQISPTPPPMPTPTSPHSIQRLPKNSIPSQSTLPSVFSPLEQDSHSRPVQTEPVSQEDIVGIMSNQCAAPMQLYLELSQATQMQSQQSLPEAKSTAPNPPNREDSATQDLPHTIEAEADEPHDIEGENLKPSNSPKRKDKANNKSDESSEMIGDSQQLAPPTTRTSPTHPSPAQPSPSLPLTPSPTRQSHSLSPSRNPQQAMLLIPEHPATPTRPSKRGVVLAPATQPPTPTPPTPPAAGAETIEEQPSSCHSPQQTEAGTGRVITGSLVAPAHEAVVWSFQESEVEEAHPSQGNDEDLLDLNAPQSQVEVKPTAPKEQEEDAMSDVSDATVDMAVSPPNPFGEPLDMDSAHAMLSPPDARIPSPNPLVPDNDSVKDEMVKKEAEKEAVKDEDVKDEMGKDLGMKDRPEDEGIEVLRNPEQTVSIDSSHRGCEKERPPFQDQCSPNTKPTSVGVDGRSTTSVANHANTTSAVKECEEGEGPGAEGRHWRRRARGDPIRREEDPSGIQDQEEGEARRWNRPREKADEDYLAGRKGSKGRAVTVVAFNETESNHQVDSEVQPDRPTAPERIEQAFIRHKKRQREELLEAAKSKSGSSVVKTAHKAHPAKRRLKKLPGTVAFSDSPMSMLGDSHGAQDSHNTEEPEEMPVVVTRGLRGRVPLIGAGYEDSEALTPSQGDTTVDQSNVDPKKQRGQGDRSSDEEEVVREHHNTTSLSGTNLAGVEEAPTIDEDGDVVMDGVEDPEAETEDVSCAHRKVSVSAAPATIQKPRAHTQAPSIVTTPTRVTTPPRELSCPLKPALKSPLAPQPDAVLASVAGKFGDKGLSLGQGLMRAVPAIGARVQALWSSYEEARVVSTDPLLNEIELEFCRKDKARVIRSCGMILRNQPPPISALVPGVPVAAQWRDGAWYEGVIEARCGKKRYFVLFEDGQRESVSRKEIRLLGTAVPTPGHIVLTCSESLFFAAEVVGGGPPLPPPANTLTPAPTPFLDIVSAEETRPTQLRIKFDHGIEKVIEGWHCAREPRDAALTLADLTVGMRVVVQQANGSNFVSWRGGTVSDTPPANPSPTPLPTPSCLIRLDDSPTDTITVPLTKVRQTLSDCWVTQPSAKAMCGVCSLVWRADAWALIPCALCGAFKHSTCIAACSGLEVASAPGVSVSAWDRCPPLVCEECRRRHSCPPPPTTPTSPKKVRFIQVGEADVPAEEDSDGEPVGETKGEAKSKTHTLVSPGKTPQHPPTPSKPTDAEDGDCEGTDREPSLRPRQQRGSKRKVPRRQRENKRAKPSTPSMSPGDNVLGNWERLGKWYLGKVTAVNSNGSVDILYDDGDVETGLKVPKRVKPISAEEASRLRTAQASKGTRRSTPTLNSQSPTAPQHSHSAVEKHTPVPPQVLPVPSARIQSDGTKATLSARETRVVPRPAVATQPHTVESLSARLATMRNIPQPFANAAVLLTGLKAAGPDSAPVTNAALAKLVTQLGGTVHAHEKDVVDLISAMNSQGDSQELFLLADAPKCTQKYLFALAMGVRPLHYRYVLDTAETVIARREERLEWMPYLLPAGINTRTNSPVSFITSPSLPYPPTHRVFSGVKLVILGPNSFQDTWSPFLCTIGAYPTTDPDECEDCMCALIPSPPNPGPLVIPSSPSHLADRVKELGLRIGDANWLKQCLICHTLLPIPLQPS